jgi:enamine deaminase RidA (YjgF/YER057c/UK114 family)
MMITKTKVFVKKLKQTVREWDEAFDKLQVKEYPLRLLAQVQYREQVEALIATRLLVEERLINFDKRVKLLR